MSRSKSTWASVKGIFRLDQEEIEMAKRLGKTPEDVYAMRPSPHEPWKDPVAQRIRRLYHKRYGSGPHLDN